MDDYIYNLSLDLNCNKSMPSINSAQFDKNRKFAVSITANGEPFSVLGCQATLKCIHSDKSSSSLDCTDGISQTGTTVTVTLRENTLPVRGMTAAKLVFSDGTRNYSTQIFLIDVDSSLDGNIRAKEEFSVLNKLIDDVRDVIDNANNTMISGYESLTPDITFDIENSNVAGYLTNDDYTFTNDNAYNGADYASTNVPVTIDSTVNERPNGGDIAIPEGGVKLTLYDTVAKTKWSVNVSGDTYIVKNLIPNRLYSYVVSDTNGVVIKTGSCKASGQIRFIDAGKATTYDTTDPTTTFERFIFNIRDLGGWECDGGHLKYGLIYRGCRLNGNYAVGQTRYGISISPAQIDFFKNFLGIRDELDLRQVKDDPDSGNTETAGDDAIYNTPDDIKDTALGIGVDYTIIPINPYLTGVEIKSSNAEMNRRYANVIKRIARDIKEGKPCYIHCLEGADRTGTVVMLILAICGVSRNDIERDYELTSYSKDYAGHRNRRARIDTAQNYRWMNLMVYLLGNSFTGSSFRDKVVDYVLKIGVTIEEINTIRAGLIDGEPEKISSPYTDASVQYYLTNVITDNPVPSIPMYQPFEATLTALNIQNVVVTMGGTDITLTVYSQGKISIPRVTGNITVTATASGSEYDDTELRELIADYDNGYLINGFALESGTVDASGNEVENNKAMRMTEMIPYASVISCDFLSRTGNLYIAYYDSEGNFVIRVGYTPTQTAVLSSNYPYFRMCFYENVTPSHTETEFKSWVTLKTKTAIKSELDEKADQADVTAALNTKADLAETSAALAGKLDAPVNKLGAVTPSITEIDKLCSLNTLAERASTGSAYSRFSIQGGNLYLVSGKAATNADAYCLCGFLDGENNVLAKFGTESSTIYNDLLAIAPEGATALIVNTNSSSGSPISCYNAEYDTDCIDEIKRALESIPTKMSDLTNDSGYITERDLDGKANAPIIKGEAITADSTVSGKIYRFDNGTEYITETGMYSDYTVQGGKLYLISGKAGQSASVYCLGGFFDDQDNLLKTFGTDVEIGGKVYTDYAVTAPDNAVKVRVNTRTPNPIACYNAEYDTDCIDEIKGTITQLSRNYSLSVADALIRQEKKNPFQLAALDKGYVTFVFDDLMNEIDSIASIFEQYQMPLCLAAIPAKMSQRATWLEQTRGSFTPNMLKSEIMRVVVSNGGEILAHNTAPVVNVTNQYDYDFMYGYFVKCKKAIEEEGFRVRGIIRAGGTGAISGTPEIERWLIGNYEYSNIGSAENYNKDRININQPLNDLKAAIQDAYTNHTWLRIMGHGYGAEHLGDYLPDEAALEAILDYCNTLGITVCTYAYIFDNFSSSAFLESLKGNQ